MNEDIKFKTIRVKEIYIDTIENSKPKGKILNCQIHETGNKDFKIGITYMYI